MTDNSTAQGSALQASATPRRASHCSLLAAMRCRSSSNGLVGCGVGLDYEAHHVVANADDLI
jgi:hypothetical protein